MGWAVPTFDIQRIKANANDQERQETTASEPGAPGQESGRQVGDEDTGSQGSPGGSRRRYHDRRDGAAAGREEARSGRREARDSSQRRRPHEVAARPPDRLVEKGAG